MINGRAENCYRLTDYAKKWIRKNIPTVACFYKPATIGTTHDLKLFEELAKLGVKYIEHAMTEYDIINTQKRRSKPSRPLYTRIYPIITGGLFCTLMRWLSRL